MVRTSLTTITRRIHIADDTEYLTAGQIKRRYGDVSDMWIWRYMKRHGFPKPVKFGGPTSARHWRLCEIEQWERERAKQAGES